jgi:hypothetical protein
MSNLTGAPADVVRVHEAMLANAKSVWPNDPEFAQNAIYTRMGDHGEDIGSWLIGPNFEGLGGTMIRHPDGTWWYRPWMPTGPDKPMQGVQGALNNACIWFTG